MPLYEYRCTKCGEQFEVRQAMGQDGSNLNCPKCKAAKPEKLISSFSSIGGSGSFSIGNSCSTFSGST
jgi:putative FmdB family regulatory protein